MIELIVHIVHCTVHTIVDLFAFTATFIAFLANVLIWVISFRAIQHALAIGDISSIHCRIIYEKVHILFNIACCTVWRYVATFAALRWTHWALVKCWVIDWVCRTRLLTDTLGIEELLGECNILWDRNNVAASICSVLILQLPCIKHSAFRAACLACTGQAVWSTILACSIN
jgi:hypothetical protein